MGKYQMYYIYDVKRENERAWENTVSTRERERECAREQAKKKRQQVSLAEL